MHRPDTKLHKRVCPERLALAEQARRRSDRQVMRILMETEAQVNEMRRKRLSKLSERGS